MEIDPTGLLHYQIPAAAHLLDVLTRNGAALDGSDMGVGKTYIGGAVIRALNVPTLVVCPQISITSWKRAGEHLGTEFDVNNYEMLRTGRTPFGTWENMPDGPPEQHLECTQCQLRVKPEDPFRCQYHPAGIHCVRVKKVKHDYGKFLWHPNIKLILFDEVQRCGGADSLNADMLIGAKRAGIKILGASATVADSPLNLRALGYALGLHGLVDRQHTLGFYKWAFRQGCRKSPFGGLEFGGTEMLRRERMAALHASIYPERGIRVKIADLGDQFPECQITAELYDLKEADRINELYAEMDEAIAELNERREKDMDGPLQRVLRAKQEIELLKVPLFADVYDEAISAGKTVGIFVNYTATLDALQKRLKLRCRIDGTQVGAAGQRRRQEMIDAIQAEQERGILLNNQAGGLSISLQDLTGNYPRLGVVSMPNSASMFRQICGRFPRAGGKSVSLYRVILAAGTVEVKHHRVLAQKLNQLDALNDGDLWAANLPLSEHSLQDLTRDLTD